MDADNSAPVQFVFSLSSILLAFSTMFFFSTLFPTVLELVVIWIATYLCFRWIIFALFTRLTTHRGIFHSIPASLFFGFLTSAISYHFFHLASLQAWLNGLFVCFGYLLHLILDELYSVNVFGMRTKRSLGTALKFHSKASPPATIYMYLALVAAFMATPTVTPLARLAKDTQIYHQIQQKFMPQETWFLPIKEINVKQSEDTILGLSAT